MVNSSTGGVIITARGEGGEKSIRVILDPRIPFLSKQRLPLAYPMKSLSRSLCLSHSNSFCFPLRILQICLAVTHWILCFNTLYWSSWCCRQFSSGNMFHAVPNRLSFPNTKRQIIGEERGCGDVSLLHLSVFVCQLSSSVLFPTLVLVGYCKWFSSKAFCTFCVKCQIYELFDSCAVSL